jgi:hypothetical protein
MPVAHCVDAGTLILSDTLMMLPLPSHTFCWQVPGGTEITVPKGKSTPFTTQAEEGTAQVPLEHTSPDGQTLAHWPQLFGSL